MRYVRSLHAAYVDFLSQGPRQAGSASACRLMAQAPRRAVAAMRKVAAHHCTFVSCRMCRLAVASLDSCVLGWGGAFNVI
jgi:hypothetical protein